MNKIKLNKYQSISFFILAIIISALCFLPCLTVKNTSYALIESTGGYTGVMEDLQKDESFDVKNYPVIENDYSLQVITIAESAENELFVYVYQPSADDNFCASYITLSHNFHNALDVKVYSLTLLDSDNVFYKYVVNECIVNSDQVRYYEIIDILRPFNKKVDTNETDNIINDVTYKVAKQFVFNGKGENLTVSVFDTETIEITDKYVGFCRYLDGYNLWPTSCDAHFVAFDTDKPIDKLYEADVYYKSQSYKYTEIKYSSKDPYYTFGDIEENYKYLNYTQEGSYTANGLGGYTYNFPRIQTSAEFIKSEEWSNVFEYGVFNVGMSTSLQENVKSQIENKSFVLRFAETDYYKTYYEPSKRMVTRGTIIQSVKILRLKFETNGVTYNLGVVDNMQSGNGDPANNFSREISIPAKVQLAIILILLIVICILFPQVAPYILKILLWIVTAPFKLIKIIIETFKN